MSKPSTIPDLTRIQPLIGSNYRRWSEELLFFFQEVGIEYVLIDEISSSSADAASSSEGLILTKKREGTYEDHNRTCRGHILKHLSEKLFDIYVKYDSAKEIWSSLKKKYGGEDEGKKQYVTSLWTAFSIKDDSPMLDQLHDYEVIVSKIQGEGMTIDDHLAALVLIDKLPPSWSQYRSKLKHEKKKMSLDELISDIMIEEANQSYTGSNHQSRKYASDANVVESTERNNDSNRTHKKKTDKTSVVQDTDFKKKIKCWNCNRKGWSDSISSILRKKKRLNRSSPEVIFAFAD